MDEKLEFNKIIEFVNSIKNYSDEEILENIKNIILYLNKKNYDYDLKVKFIAFTIRHIKNSDLKVELIKKYFYNFYGFGYDWNQVISVLEPLSREDRSYILNILLKKLTYIEVTKKLNIPDNLKFGIELEYYGISFETIKKLFLNKKIDEIMDALSVPQDLITSITQNSDFEKENEFNKLIFSKEGSDDYPEASSPIMTNTLYDLNQIKVICTIFDALDAQVNGGTGLHINIGVDYFNNNVDALKYLLIIWSECEELFFKICNKENEEIRVRAINMAIPIKKNIQKTIEENINISLESEEEKNKFMYNIQVRDRLNNLLGYMHGDLEFELMKAKTEDEKYNVFKKYLEQKQDDDNSIKYTSINFNHMTWNKENKGRIEFRLFNSSLDYDTIAQNILLIGKLCEICLKLTNKSESKQQQFIKLLNHDISEEDKLDLLLDLLFNDDKEKQIFKQRWLSIKNKTVYRKYQSGNPTFISDEKINYLKKIKK